MYNHICSAAKSCFTENSFRLFGLALLALGLFIKPDLVLAQSDSFLTPNGPIAAYQKTHFWNVIIITMIAIVPVFVLLPYILWRYRRKNKASTYSPKWDESLGLESLMWGVPIFIVICLSYTLWNATYKLDPYKEIAGDNQLNVQVVGLDWKWLFIYPDLGIATVGEFALPTGRPVSLTLTTDTVMQSFLISALAGQIYAMPGMTTELNLFADEPLIMEGENTQYNGEGFIGQKFDAISLSPNNFKIWVEEVKKKGVRLNTNTYRILARRATKTESFQTLGTPLMPDNVLYFRLDDPHLFHSIVQRYHSGKALSNEAQPGSPTYQNSLATEEHK